MTLQERLREWAHEGGPRTRYELEQEAADRIEELEQVIRNTAQWARRESYLKRADILDSVLAQPSAKAGGK